MLPQPDRPMDCTDFLHHYSDFRDDDLADASLKPVMDEHLASCRSCARYHTVMESGAALLRELPGPTYRDDFRERLQHRLYLSELDPSAESGLASRRALGMSTPVAAGLAATLFLVVLAAWGPVVESVTPPPQATLPAISASLPPGALVQLRAVPGPTNRPSSRGPAALVEPDLWAQSHILLYEHSSLYHRNRGGGLVQAGAGLR